MTFLDYNKRATVDVFAVCWNEEAILNDWIKYYYRHFGAKITIFDNNSTDKSERIIKYYGCTYKRYDTDGQIRDDIYLELKNNFWKNSKADFVIVADIDEFLEVPFNCENYSIINTKGYDIVGDINSRLGVANPLFDKVAMFRPNCIQEIRYAPGCHSCKPVGNISGSKEFATLLHRKYISEEYVYAKHKQYEARLSEFNKKFGYGVEYENVTEEKIKEKFAKLRSQAILIP